MAEKKTLKKPVAKTTNTSSKKPETKANVRVETKTISKPTSCPMGACCCTDIKKILLIIWGLLVTGLLIFVLLGQDKLEIIKAGGAENYKILKQIYKTDGYKEQQKQQLEQALQIFSNPEQFMPSFENAGNVEFEDINDVE